MIHKLSEIDRTLLSAYLDNEVTVAERLSAEQLLATSEPARGYLNELRAVNELSGNGLAAPVVVGAAALPVASRLTGSAIEAIARRAAVKKAMALTTWKIAGVVTATAAAATGVMLTVGRPTVKEKPPAAHTGVAQKDITPQIPAQQVSSLDTNDLLVPPMTAADLYAFAVHGTLPMDSKRESFITVAPKGKDSFEVQVHGNSPIDLHDEFKELDESDLHTLDSIQRVIRTSLIQYSNGNIALRADIPSIRLGAIRTLERAKAQLPAHLREQLNRTRAELDRIRPEFNAPEEQDAPPPQVTYQPSAPQESIKVPYMVISMKKGSGGGRESNVNTSGQMVVGQGNRQTFSVDRNQLKSLESMLKAAPPRPPIPPEAVEEEETQQRFNVVVRPPAHPKKPRHIDEVQDNEGDESETSVNINGSEDALRLQRQREYQYIISNDTLLLRADSSLRSARRSIIRIDTMLNRLRIRTRSSGGAQSSIIIDSNGSLFESRTSSRSVTSEGGRVENSIVINSNGSLLESRTNSRSVTSEGGRVENSIIIDSNGSSLEDGE